MLTSGGTREPLIADPDFTLYVGVARKMGRRAIGVELNSEYADLAARRLQQLSLFAE